MIDNRVPCCFCGEPAQGQYREVTGWEQVRDGGGANKIIRRRETGRYACNACAVDIKGGVSLAQQGLF